jgi:hypothetical protein
MSTIVYEAVDAHLRDEVCDLLKRLIACDTSARAASRP